MKDRAVSLAGPVSSADEPLQREFEERLADSSSLAFRLAYSVLRDRPEAEDVAQEALAKAFRSFRKLRDRNRFRAWLARTAWRMAIDRQRGNRRRLLRDAAALSMQPVSVDPRVRERSAALWQAIDALPEKLRITIVLANMEGHDVAQVAALLSIPEGTVKSRLFDARKRLREQLSWMKDDPRR
jgi:RNA polymerase sigma-70 factor (ECF subfamily)